MKIARETSSGPALLSTHEGHTSQIKLEEQKQGEKLPELAMPIVTAWSLAAKLVAFHQSPGLPYIYANSVCSVSPDLMPSTSTSQLSRSCF